MEVGLITTLLGVILSAIFSQTIAVWVKFSNIEKRLTLDRAALEGKIEEKKCPFGECPLYTRARGEAVASREVKES